MHITLPGMGTFTASSGLVARPATSDGRFRTGHSGVNAIAATGDGKVEFVGFDAHTLAHVRSALGAPAYYPVPSLEPRSPIRAVLMDLDGTSVRSEPFWIGMIEQTTATLRRQPGFQFDASDIPFVSGHSVSEHLAHCITRYVPDASIEQARAVYFDLVRREMAAILEGRGRANTFVPVDGLRDFLLALKARNIRIALVTSGLYEKAWPEVVAAFAVMRLGDPAAFYDAIVTAGTAIRQGQPGTLGELSPKPHPWLYLEALRVGLGVPIDDRGGVLGLEDSGAGICALRLSGVRAIGMAQGNIVRSGTQGLCERLCATLEDVLTWIEG